MTTRFAAPAIGVVALVIAWPASAAPLANALTAPSSLLSRVEHDHSDSDYGRGDPRSDNRRSENDRDSRRSSDRADRDEDRQESGEGWRGGKGASFWLRSGDLRLGARCAPGEPMRACVDAALLLLDKAKSAQTQVPTPSANTPTSQTR
ncbi:hypothetical protein LNAOJCKE_4603 [Methylorubrum aminovorans]|uniref:Uncharacterized protein n=1 Tax=Methylorubrum aminovorans TaxID=269069 RepID=A0ABQ4ULZ7_9HYPH|nr:hypothetical protein LNAOJCKE_4603 [Methylorubrum aminovorans]GMA80146.1 hypothetical protein GCM10025880_65630 [Methylorubrum aminovorans]GMA80221.1 hypothetical protein GCM10025880_66380 [Methylorubrum aminovorans]